MNEKIIKIDKQTKREAFSITVISDKTPGLCDSKFGGVPYWDAAKEYPVDHAGNKLVLLAQINLEQLEQNEMFPDKGMLQFFICIDDVYGLDFDEPDTMSQVCVIYHESIDESITKDDILKMDIPTTCDLQNDEYSPLCGELAISIEKQEICMGVCDYRFEKLYAKEAIGNESDACNLYEALNDEEFDMLSERNSGHWLLGYPYFTQEDPRGWKENLHYYDTLLLQMDSEMEDSYEIMWGDMGVANFFINSEDLKNKDFSKILYNWDCC